MTVLTYVPSTLKAGDIIERRAFIAASGDDTFKVFSQAWRCQLGTIQDPGTHQGIQVVRIIGKRTPATATLPGNVSTDSKGVKSEGIAKENGDCPKTDTTELQWPNNLRYPNHKPHWCKKCERWCDYLGQHAATCRLAADRLDGMP